MADISIQGALSISHGGMTVGGNVSLDFNLDAAGEKVGLTQPLTTSLADINTGSISWSEITWLWLANLSITPGEDITITKSAIEIGLLKPGEFYGPIRAKADGTAMRAKSATGTPMLQVVAAGALA